MNVFKKVVRICSYVALAIGVGLLIMSGFHDDRLEVLKYDFQTQLVSEDFKAVVVADLHHRESLTFKGGDNLVNKIKEENPNAIFLCGDLVDDWNDKNLKNQKELLDGIKNIPTYYVSGNHEHRSPYFKPFLDLVKEREWVHFIDDKFKDINDNIRVFGLHDKLFNNETRKETGMSYKTIEEQLEIFKPDIKNDKLNILLSHNPLHMDIYKKYGFNAVMCGHTHGGQFRINEWSLLSLLHGDKTFNAGEYKIDNNPNQRAYVTKGLGYSAMFPIRVNCRPDIISIKFHK